MPQYPPFSSAEIAGQRWYCGLAVALCIVMAVMIRQLPKQRFRGLARLWWGGLPLMWCSLLGFGSSAGVGTQWLLTFFVIHNVLNLWGIFTEIRQGKESMQSALPLLVQVILVGNLLLLPGVSTSRWTTDQSWCMNNLKHIGLGIHNTYEVGAFQPVSGTPAVSWRVQLPPLMDAKSLGAGYDPAVAWDAAPNRQVGSREPTPYRCPSHRAERSVNGWATTDYALITGPGTIFPTSDTVLDFKQVGDGISNTILAVECAGLQIPWTEPRDVDINHVPFTLNELGADGGSPSVVSSHHTNPSHEWHQIHVLMVDGSVKRFNPAETDPAIMRKMMTANGGEEVEF